MSNMNYRSIAVALLLLAGCVRSNVDMDGAPAAANSTIEFAMSKPTTVATRSGEGEMMIQRGYILAFKADGSYIGCQAVAAADVTKNNSQYPKIEVSIAGYDSKSDKLIAVFNYCETSFTGVSSFTGMTYKQVSEKFPLDKEYLAKLQAKLAVGDYSLGMPMYVNDFDDTDGNSVREVYRSLARVELYVRESNVSVGLVSHVHKFTPDNVRFALINSAENGEIGYNSRGDVEGKMGGTTGADFKSLTYDKSASLYTPGTDITATKSSSNAIYLYEFPYSTKVISGGDLTQGVYDPERLSIMIKHWDDAAHPGITYYYKLQLIDKLKNEYFDIKRNHDYRILINEVYSDGYTDPEEAYLLPPSNIEYEVYDDQGDTTLSNGQYAISMDEVLNYENITIYGPNTIPLNFDNIRRILPEGVTDGLSNAEIEKMTNSVVFRVIKEDGVTVNVKKNDFSGDGKLTDSGRSIKLELTGDGSCTIQLKIKLGNLELGFDEITIEKVKGEFGGDSSFDAHPGQLTIEKQNMVAGSWNSPDSDFGARNDGDNMVVYMGENATPVGYRSLNGHISTGAAANSYPHFEPKTREGYFSYYDLENDPGRTKVKKAKIVLNQLAPFYVGHFGSLANNGPHYYNGVIVEKIEEIPDNRNGKNLKNGGLMHWSESSGKQFYSGKIYGQFLTLNKYLNFSEGHDIAEDIVLNNQTEGALPLAARYCYMKNDIDGDGVIEDDEPIVWYLPAVNQMLAMWVSKHMIDSEIDAEYFGFDLGSKDGEDNPWYWTCSEVQNVFYGDPDNFTINIASFNMLEGEMNQSKIKGITGSQWNSDDKAHVRCVRGIRYDNTK